VPPKDPHVVLGVERGASPDEIKAAWRTLARRHHPDLTGDDPEVARRATRRMAEINTAYASLTRAGETAEARRRREDRAGEWDSGGAAPGSAGPGAGRRHGPPPDPVTRPVTGRLDTSKTVRARNQTTSPPGTRIPLTGQPPLRYGRSAPELRASQPSGPTERDWAQDHVQRVPPSLEDALGLEVVFGKFHGHTLGEIADFEPSYIDWLATTLTRDPELALAARVIAGELDRRGVRRIHRPSRTGWQSNPFR
jgi:hypothetical protein